MKGLLWGAAGGVLGLAALAGLAPIRGTLPDLGHHPSGIPVPGDGNGLIVTRTMRLGPSDEVRAWIQRDTTLLYLATRCTAGTYRIEATPSQTFTDTAWTPIPPGRLVDLWARALCDVAPLTAPQRLLTRVRWILPPLPSRPSPVLTAATPERKYRADNPFAPTDPLVRQYEIVVRLRSWQREHRDTVTLPGVDSAAFADSVLASCPDQPDVMARDTFSDAVKLRLCAEAWLKRLSRGPAGT